MDMADNDDDDVNGNGEDGTMDYKHHQEEEEKLQMDKSAQTQPMLSQLTQRTGRSTQLEEKMSMEDEKKSSDIMLNKYHNFTKEYDEVYQEQRARWISNNAKTQMDLLEEGLQNLQIAEQQTRRKYPTFYWIPGTPLACKVDFILKTELFTTHTNPDILVQYFITLQDLNEPEHTAAMVESLFMQNARLVGSTIEKNLAFLLMCNPTTPVFSKTPFADMNLDSYRQSVFRLILLHGENIRWHAHMKASKEARAAGTPIPPLCEPPPISDLARPNADRDSIKYTNHEKLLYFFFQKAGSQGLRRTEKNVYAPIFTDQGHNTRCFKLVSDIETWIRSQLDDELHPEEYHMFMEKPGTHSLVALHMGKQPNPLFPFLQRCRTLWSYVNGIYNGHNRRFYAYDSPRIADPKIRTVKLLRADVATAKYFNRVVNPAWFEEGFDYVTGIPCPITEKLFQHHGYFGESLRWIGAFNGRLQHDIGSLDEWGIALHYKGPPKTGKSAFLTGIREWYMTEDIGMITDDVEKFADQHLLRCFIVMCMDISCEFGLPSTRFLSWCSGDWLNIFQKFAESIAHKWRAPPIFGSNDDPPITVQGAFRRFVIIAMMVAVENASGDMAKGVIEEAPFYLIKCSFDYHEKVQKFGKSNLWERIDGKRILPDVFWKSKYEFIKRHSWADAYVLSGELIFGKYEEGNEFRMLESEFQAGFKTFRDSHRDAVEVVISSKTRKEVAFKCTRHNFNNALKEHGGAEWRDDGYVYGVKPKHFADSMGELGAGAARANRNNFHRSNNIPPPVVERKEQPPSTTLTEDIASLSAQMGAASFQIGRSQRQISTQEDRKESLSQSNNTFIHSQVTTQQGTAVATTRPLMQPKNVITNGSVYQRIELPIVT